MKKCNACSNEIPVDAKKCAECGAYQNWIRYVNSLNVLIGVAASIIALLIAVNSNFLPIFQGKAASLKFSEIDVFDIDEFDSNKSFQISKLSSVLKVVNLGNTDAIIDGIIVENTAVASQLYFAEGCGESKSIQGNIISSKSGLKSINFTMRYSIGFIEQLIDPIIGIDVQHIDLGYAATQAKQNIRETANVYVLWSDPNGQFLSIVRQKSIKRSVQYKQSDGEMWTGGADATYCFTADLRQRLGLGKSFKTGSTIKISPR